MSEDKHYQGHRARLRVRLENAPDKLHDYEILELLLGKVLTRKDTKPLAKDLLLRFESIRGILDAKPAEIQAVPGFGPALENFRQLLREVMARYAEAPARQREFLSSTRAVADMARSRLAGQAHEEVWAAYVDAQNRLLAWEKSSRGSIGQASVYPREIMERAILLKASGFILVHNHPGGNAAPSAADLQITEQLRHSAQILGLRFLDHIIVTDSGYASLLSK